MLLPPGVECLMSYRGARLGGHCEVRVGEHGPCNRRTCAVLSLWVEDCKQVHALGTFSYRSSGGKYL